jgi:hypothetical protein
VLTLGVDGKITIGAVARDRNTIVSKRKDVLYTSTFVDFLFVSFVDQKIIH